MSQKKKKVEIGSEVSATVENTPQEPKPTPPVENAHVAPEIQKDKSVKVRNQGKPFLCDLMQYGYGMRWPTNAVYTIPLSVYLKLLKDGLDGTYA